jgi:hypothetical protein
MPPNASGASFIHDVAIVNTAEVKAQVLSDKKHVDEWRWRNNSLRKKNRRTLKKKWGWGEGLWGRGRRRKEWRKERVGRKQRKEGNGRWRTGGRLKRRNSSWGGKIGVASQKARVKGINAVRSPSYHFPPFSLVPLPPPTPHPHTHTFPSIFSGKDAISQQIRSPPFFPPSRHVTSPPFHVSRYHSRFIFH